MVNLEWIETDGNVIFGNPKDPNVHHSPPIEPKRSIGHNRPTQRIQLEFGSRSEHGGKGRSSKESIQGW